MPSHLAKLVKPGQTGPTGQTGQTGQNLAAARLGGAPRVREARGHLVDVREHLLGELQLERLDVVLELRRARGPDDGRGHEGARRHEREREVRHRHPVLGRDPRVLRDGLRRQRGLVARAVALEEVEAAVGVAPLVVRLVHRGLVLGELSGGGGDGELVLAGEHPRRQRRVRDQRRVRVRGRAHLGHRRVELAGEKRVGVLHRDGLRQALLHSEGRERHHAERRLVGEAPVPHLPLLDELSHSLELLLERHRRHLKAVVVLVGPEKRHVAVRPVDLQEVDIVRPQALE
mmetsp:Transcript_55223/g.131170  ORF Transcript_55223/g.131170 Transcript_55223/m.131170 type:complete len:288 (-) Transcript_55223:616-1479(-)